MLSLIDDAELRQRTTSEGVARAKALLRWDEERGRLLAAYDVALQGSRQRVGRPVPMPAHE
jgi:hypothetical protein